MEIIEVAICGMLGYLVADNIFRKSSREQVNSEPVKFEDTDLGKKLIYDIQQVIDSCNTAEDAQVKIWEFCENLSDDSYSGVRQIIIAYFEQKFNVKNIDKNDVIKKELIKYLKNKNNKKGQTK